MRGFGQSQRKSGNAGAEEEELEGALWGELVGSFQPAGEIGGVAEGTAAGGVGGFLGELVEKGGEFLGQGSFRFFEMAKGAGRLDLPIEDSESVHWVCGCPRSMLPAATVLPAARSTDSVVRMRVG